MMLMEFQVCSPEYAKQLRLLGVKQISYFYWDILSNNATSLKYLAENVRGVEYYSAFTVAELGTMLPENIPNEGDLLMWNFLQDKKRYFGIEYVGSSLNYFTNRHESNARAQMLIYLLENKLIKVEDLPYGP